MKENKFWDTFSNYMRFKIAIAMVVLIVLIILIVSKEISKIF
jgi:hypothetical protein